jgi:hypothetical protein
MANEQVASPQNEITGQVMFYRRPEPLSPEAHGRLKLKSSADIFGFAAQAHIVPLQVGEFGPASLNYPVIFVGEGRLPMAVLGMRQGENLFVNAEGRWEDLAYLPGFVRRYPFVLAGSDQNEQLVVCVDREAPMVSDDGDVALFADGALTPAGQAAVQFCSDYETERRRTEQFIEHLRRLDLFEAKTATFTPRNPDGGMGQPIPVADYFAVSEEKLRALGDKDLRELHAAGGLRQIALHLNSMFNWERLIGRAAMRAPVPNAA